jgi:copper resistance protein B
MKPMKTLSVFTMTLLASAIVDAADDAHEAPDHRAHSAYTTHAAHESSSMQASPAMQGTHSMGDMHTDPWLTYARVDQFEWRDGDDDSIMAWDVTAWTGKSIDKLWLNADGERVRGHTERAEVQLLYGHAISSYWDLQAGIRSDIDPMPDQHWASFGVRGLAPYFFDVDAQLFVADQGRTGARLSAEYELMLTQRLVLVPEFEIDAYGKDDVERGIGSGFSSLEAGLRLRYEIVREFAPYIGLSHERKLGDTADMVDDDAETMLVIGISAWL